MNLEDEIELGGSKFQLRSACLHRGSKADFGHYVAVYKDEGWVLCNDSKVVDITDVPTGESYLVLYEKEWFVCSGLHKSGRFVEQNAHPSFVISSCLFSRTPVLLGKSTWYCASGLL